MFKIRKINKDKINNKIKEKLFNINEKIKELDKISISNILIKADSINSIVELRAIKKKKNAKLGNT